MFRNWISSPGTVAKPIKPGHLVQRRVELVCELVLEKDVITWVTTRSYHIARRIPRITARLELLRSVATIQQRFRLCDPLSRIGARSVLFILILI